MTTPRGMAAIVFRRPVLSCNQIKEVKPLINEVKFCIPCKKYTTKKAKLSEKMSEVIKIKGLNKIFQLQKFLKTETPYFLEHILLFHVAPENLGPHTAPG